MHTLAPRLSGLALCVAAVSITLGPAVPRAAEPSPAATAATAKTAATSPRAPDAGERAAMLEVLKAESAPDRAAWLSYSSGDAEGLALADALAAIFREGGWKVEVSALSGMVLKPGVSMLVAEEEPPSWVETALRALQASGIDVKSAIGYRSYYEDKKKENAAWPGVPLAKDAAFVIIVGPASKS